MGTGANKEPEKTDKEKAREQTRMLNRSSRTIEREINKLDLLEKKQMKEVEMLAKKG